jgi:bacteriophage exclusion system BrxA-like protein
MTEVTTPHTGLLRLGLAVSHSVKFWSRATTDQPVDQICSAADREQWFGVLTESRLKYLVGQLQKRFPYPARKLLSFRPRPEPHQNTLICHWHLQLTDPLYREYTSSFLLSCWSGPTTSVSIDSSASWVKRQPLAREWATSTQRRMASGLLSAATEAGLVARTGRNERELKLPTVDSENLMYLRKLLREADATDNEETYLMSLDKSAVGEKC